MTKNLNKTKVSKKLKMINKYNSNQSNNKILHKNINHNKIFQTII